MHLHRTLTILALGSMLVLSGCATNPVTKQSDFMIYSEQDEISMGKEYHPEVLDEYGQYTDKKLGTYVNVVGQKVASVSDRPNLDYTFTVLDSPIVNAFAVPGGYIYITRGLLEQLNSEDELAGVLGHEVGHVCARDSVRTLSSQLGLNILLVGVSSFMKPEDVEAWAPWVNGGMFLAMRSYGRDAEFRADELGSRYATAAGYSPRGNTDVLRTLRKLGDVDPGSVAELLQTHPSSASRVDRARVLQRELEDQVGKIPEKKDAYKDAIAGMVVGNGDRQGRIIGNAYLNKMYDIYFEFPKEMSDASTDTTGTLFYGKNSSGEFVALQAVTLAEAKSARDYAAAAEKQGGVSPMEGAERKAGGRDGWMAKYKDETKGTYTTRFYTVDGKQAFILSCATKLARAGDNTNMLDSSLGTVRKLTDAEKAELAVKRLEVYTVAKGDSLASIAKKYNVKEQGIIDYNVLDTSDLYVGQRVKIPAE